MSRIQAGLPLAALAALVAAGVLSACSSSSGADSPGSPPPTTPTHSVTTPSRASASHPATSSPPASPQHSGGSRGSGGTGVSQCAESQLRASVQPEQIAGLTRHVVRLVFVNTSPSPCTLYGYPGAAIVDSAGRQVQQAKRVVGGPVAGTVEAVRTVTVRPGSSAYAYLEGADTREVGAAQAGCDGPKYPRILVTPPNTRTAVPFTVGWPQCYAFDVHPVRQQ